VKHDAAKVVEFTRDNGSFVNGLGSGTTRRHYIFPLLSPPIWRTQTAAHRFVLLTQYRVADPTDEIKILPPEDVALPARPRRSPNSTGEGSSIYMQRARFSISGW